MRLTRQMCNEQSGPNAKWGKESGPVLLGCEHEDAEDELKGQEHLDEQAPHHRGASAQARAYCEGPWEQGQDDGSSCDSRKQLGDDEQSSLEPGDGSDECHGNGDLRGVSRQSSSDSNDTLTAGLKSPPLTRKKIHTLTASETANASEMYSSDRRSMGSSPRRLLATCAAAKAKNRNRKVPTNSPIHAMSRLRALLGSHEKPGSRGSPGRSGSSVYLVFTPGWTMVR
jgi:hypothetical protein